MGTENQGPLLLYRSGKIEGEGASQKALLFKAHGVIVTYATEPRPLLIYCELVQKDYGVDPVRLKHEVLVMPSRHPSLTPESVDVIRAKAREWGVESDE